MSSTRPAPFFGCRPPTITVEQLTNDLQRAVLRACTSTRFTRVAVILMHWDHDDAFRFLHGSGEIEHLFTKSYNYKCFPVALQARLDLLPLPQHIRDYEALRTLWVKFAHVRKSYGEADDLIIIHYRGYGCVNPSNPGELLLTSQFPTTPKLPFTTKVNLHEALDIFGGIPARLAMFMDCCYPYSTPANKKGYSLLAACGAGQEWNFAETGFNQNLIDVLQTAYNTRRWLTLGGIHREMQARVAQWKLDSSPLWKTRKEHHLTPSPMFHDIPMPVPGPPEVPPVDITHDLRRVIIDNLSLLKLGPQESSEGAYVLLCIHATNATPKANKALEKAFERLSTPELKGPAQQLRELKLGQVMTANPTPLPGRIQIYVDVVVFHELGWNDAFLFGGFYRELPERQTAQSEDDWQQYFDI